METNEKCTMEVIVKEIFKEEFLKTANETGMEIGNKESLSERIEIRKVRQFLGEKFILWADEYFSANAKRNTRLDLKELYDNFMEYAPEQGKWCKPLLFRKKIAKYCEYRGYLLLNNNF